MKALRMIHSVPRLGHLQASGEVGVRPLPPSGQKAPNGGCWDGDDLVVSCTSLSGHSITWSACAVLESSPRLRRATVFCISASLVAAANSSTVVQASAGLAGAAMASKGERWEGFRTFVCRDTSSLSQNGIRHCDSSVFRIPDIRHCTGAGWFK